MLLDEDPAALIHECITNFNIHPDRSSLSRISTSISTLAQSRDLRLAAARHAAKQHARQLAALQQQHNLTLAQHNPTEHAAHILKLDGAKFRVAKEASDLEIEAERLECEIGAADALLKEVDERGSDAWEGGIVGDREGEALDVLRLKLYRSLGVDVEMDARGTYRKAVLRNTARQDAAVITLDPRRQRTEYADTFWDAL